jgi:hypothetical protein
LTHPPGKNTFPFFVQSNTENNLAESLDMLHRFGDFLFRLDGPDTTKLYRAIAELNILRLQFAGRSAHKYQTNVISTVFAQLHPGSVFLSTTAEESGSLPLTLNYVEDQLIVNKQLRNSVDTQPKFELAISVRLQVSFDVRIPQLGQLRIVEVHGHHVGHLEPQMV